MKNFMEKYNVSRETYDKLKTYESLLREWQGRFNLIGKGTIENIWERHFLDSAQLINFIPNTAKKMCDFGSGAGFPGMVLAIMLQEKTPYLKVTLVESTGKKTMFLNQVKQDTNTNVEILNCRVENLSTQKFDIITSRAMTNLNNLLAYAYPYCKKETLCLFPKGKKYAEEIEVAKKGWHFDCQIKYSEQSSEGKILLINNIVKIKGGK